MVQTAGKKEKIGLLGGTFDPVHNGHIAVANHVLQALGLNSILFIPASLPPHKTEQGRGRSVSDFSHRLAMLQRAATLNSSFAVTDIEAKRSEPSYSIDTINILIPLLEKKADLFFIIGFDAFLEIDTWKRFKELPTLVNLVVISRPGYPPDKVGEIIRHNFSGYKYDPSRHVWSSPQSKGSFILQDMEPIPISSTEIRKSVKNGEAITGLVPPAVEDYIKEQGLYI